MTSIESRKYDVLLDVIEERCPMPLLKTKLAIANMKSLQTLCVLSSDNGSLNDIPYYLSVVDIPLLEQKTENSVHYFIIQKP